MVANSFYKTEKVLIISLLLLCFSLVSFAAQGPVTVPQKYATERLFKKYARNKRAVLINLEKTYLDKKGNVFLNIHRVNRVITLTLKHPSMEMVRDVEDVINNDKKNSKEIQEVYAEGYLISAYYLIGQQDKNRIYLLYRYDLERNAITLIYLEGEIDSQELLNIIMSKSKK